MAGGGEEAESRVKDMTMALRFKKWANLEAREIIKDKEM